jgi:hypothetical protein
MPILFIVVFIIIFLIHAATQQRRLLFPILPPFSGIKTAFSQHGVLSAKPPTILGRRDNAARGGEQRVLKIIAWIPDNRLQRGYTY